MIFIVKERIDGRNLSAGRRGICRGNPSVDLGMCTRREAVMNGLYVVGLVISFALLVYLLVALLKPEKF